MASTLRHRNIASPLTGGGGGGLDPIRRLRKLDIYRKVPKDLTEGSAVGGFITTISVIVLLMLTIAELRNLTTIANETELIIDRSEDGAFRINLNVTVIGLSCEFLSVDLKNALGTNREDLNDNTLHKFSLGTSQVWQGSATKKNQPAELPEIHTYDVPTGAKDHYGQERHAIELNKNNFQQTLDDHEVLLVDFHSPRCIHCVRFAPIYENAAQLVKERSPGKGVRQDSHKKFSVALATVDCIENIELCRARHIQAYPTVHVYRPNRVRQPKDVDAHRTMEDAKYFEINHEHNYEVYHGPREVEALANFALKTLDEVLSEDKTLGKDAFDKPVIFSDNQESTVHNSACRVAGYLDVRRVPGSVIIRPHSNKNAHEFDPKLINMDHRLDHLSFGNRGTFERPGAISGPYSVLSEKPAILKDGQEILGFRGKEPNSAHVHFIKVVSRTIVPLNKQAVQSYEYSITSDSFHPRGDMPFIEISFDLSPLQIVVKETKKNWIEGITAMLALIGGVYSASFIVESIISSFTTWVTDQKIA